MTVERDDLIEYLLRMGDTALIQGQRLCEWCGRAPVLEEELGLMNVGLDLVGQARHWLDYAADLIDDGRDADALAFRRDEREFRNLLLVEQPNGDFAVTMTKQFLYDAWHYEVLQGLATSTDTRIAGIAAKSLKEVTYHLRRSGEWIERLGDGTDESHARMEAAVPAVWRFTVEMTHADDLDARLFASGVAPDPHAIANGWRATIEATFERATLIAPAPAKPFYLSARKGLHTEHLGRLLAEMQYLQRAYPDATW